MVARRPQGPLDFILRPFPAESLTSWYVRLARANAVSLHELATKLLGHSVHSIATTDLDANANPAIPDGLARVSGMPIVEAKLMGLAGWQHLLSAEVNNPQRAMRWILPHRKDGSDRRRGEWTQACLQCLATDETPYFRQHWRFAFVTECVVHRLELIAACPHCSGPLDFPAMDRGHPRPERRWPLSKCPSCAVDWRIYVQRQRASDVGLWRMQRALLRGIADRWFRLTGNPVWAGLILDGIYHLLRAMRTPKVIVRVASMLLPEHDVVPLQWTPTRTPFEYLPLRERRALMGFGSAAMRRWPHSFVEMADRSGLRLSILRASRSRPPYWLDRIAQEHLDRTWFRQSSEETVSAATLLERHGLSARPWVVREWLGFYVPSRRLGVAPASADVCRQLRFWSVESETERLLRQALVTRIASVLRKWCLRRARDSRRKYFQKCCQLLQTQTTLAIFQEYAAAQP